MQTARRIVKSIFRDIFTTCLILGVFGAVIVGWSMSPTQYIYRKTEFLSYEFPEEVYHFDATGQGNDYELNTQHKNQRQDGKRFQNEVKNKENWNPLPVELGAEKHPLCDVEFDVHMRDMLSAKDGYWMISHEENLFCVYDKSKRLLYIRTASSFT